MIGADIKHWINGSDALQQVQIASNEWPGLRDAGKVCVTNNGWARIERLALDTFAQPPALIEDPQLHSSLWSITSKSLRKHITPGKPIQTGSANASVDLDAFEIARMPAWAMGKYRGCGQP